MNSINLFFSNYSTQIWTIISVIIGGLITYYSTLHLEYKKIKIKQKSDNTTNVVIPCVLCLRDTIIKLDSLRKKLNYSDDIDLHKELQFLKEPLNFLNDERNYFIPNHLRYDLKLYKKKLKLFSDTLNKECNDYITRYSNYISTKLNGYLFDDSKCIANPCFSSSVDNKVKLMLVKSRFLSLKNTLEQVIFLVEEADINLILFQEHINLDKSTRDEIENIRYAFKNGIDILEDRKRFRDEKIAVDPYYTDICYEEDEYYDTKLRMSAQLLDFIYSSNFNDEPELFSNLKDNLYSHCQFDSLFYFLNNTINKFEKYIDNVLHSE